MPGGVGGPRGDMAGGAMQQEEVPRVGEHEPAGVVAERAVTVGHPADGVWRHGEPDAEVSPGGHPGGEEAQSECAADGDERLAISKTAALAKPGGAAGSQGGFRSKYE